MIKKIILICLISLSLYSQKNINQEYLGLSSKIDNLLSLKKLKNTKFGISVFSLTKNSTVYSNNSTEALTPASTTKLFTSAAFMVKFGIDYKINTDIYIDGNFSNGILDGDLIIRGGGDALLSLNDIEDIAEKIKAYGILKINGNIYGDGSFFDKESERIQYSGDKDIVQATPPITALSINKNIATVLVTSPDSKTNKNNIQIIPPSDAFSVSQDNETFINDEPITSKKAIASKEINPKIVSKKSVQKQTQTKKKITKLNSNIKKSASKSKKQSKSKSKKKYTYLTPTLEQEYGEKRSKSKTSGFVTSTINSDGTQSFKVKGKIKKKSSTSYSHFIKNPISTTAGSLKNRLISSGIEIKGNIGEKSIFQLKNPKRIISFSRNSFDIIYNLMKHSDNYLSESLFKTLGASTKKIGSDVISAQNLILYYIDSLKLNCRDCIVNDGSGLSRRNKLSAESMTNLFKSLYNTPIFKYLDSSLAIAAIDGTIGNRMWDNNTRGNLRAKTGTHGNVSALTGLVKTLDGELLAFAFIFNGGNVNSYKQIENELGILLANFKK